VANSRYEPEVEIDIEEMLDYLGVKNLEWRGRELWFTCPFSGHATDSNTNASFRTSDKHPWWIFRCFVCGRRGTAIEFVAEAEDLTGVFARTKAKIWLKEKYGTEWHDAGDDFPDDIAKILNKGPKSKLTKRPLVGLPERILEERAVDWEAAWNAMLEDETAPPEWSMYMFRRGFTWKTLERWEIGFDPIRKMLTIPYRDAEGHLIGFKGRAWWPNAKPKYGVIGNKPGRESRYDFETADITQLAFGIHRVKPSAEPLFVCEGELNTIAMDQYGFSRTLGISGQYLSDFQVHQIADNTDEAILIFDENEKAMRAAKTLERKISVWIIPERDLDPADAESGIVEKWIDQKIAPFECPGWYDLET
jgi:hypothetical protein